MAAPALLWFRQDLRLTDNPALQAASGTGAPVIPVFLHAPHEEGDWAPGGAARWWQHQSLAALGRDLADRGAKLVMRRVEPDSSSEAALLAIARETGATSVHWNRRYEPSIIARDAALKASLRSQGLAAHSHNAALLAEPWEVRNQSGKPFQVFTPFWRSVVGQLAPPPPSPAPAALASARHSPAGQPLDALELLPRIRWYDGLASHWQPGEAGAARRLERFLDEAWLEYDNRRDVPAQEGTSRLSPHLHHGEISPRQIWHAFARRATAEGIDASRWRTSKFLAEVGWREFAHHLLYHFPDTPAEPLRAEFARFPWRDDAALLEAWQRGRTGVPLVDAGMRELWHTGWMHNRVRMVVASFLVKNLLQPWQAGARWFWDTLVDADLAANTLGWQWSAGCGADAAPYFRIFNPVTQSQRFDPGGDYLARWLPELTELDPKARHELRNAVVDLPASRDAALAAFAALRGQRSP
ncbi:MAG: deoxyribodipyrimidine photo-lyase [Steroidobacteraceae bacterium]